MAFKDYQLSFQENISVSILGVGKKLTILCYRLHFLMPSLVD